MTSAEINSPELPALPSKPAGIEKLARRAVLARLGNLRNGQIVVDENGEELSFGEVTAEFPTPAILHIHNAGFYSDIAFGGTIGSGEAFVEGHWTCNDLNTLIRMLLRNREVLQQVGSGLARLGRPVQKALHWLNRNTRKGSQRNIAAHYDLGNDFYRLWLDDRMMYSSAYFEAPDMTLDAAATAKLDRICRKLKLTPGDSVVEIGTGWGGFAIYAAENYGCHVTTTTISKQQYEFARARVAQAGLQDRITLRLDDYRDLDGRYDKLVSIEMIEAVGHRFHGTFFKKCCELLKPDGQMLLQAITMADQNYDEYTKGVDFIQRYIFPGGCLTSVTDMTQKMTRLTDMRVINLEDIGLHYADTLRHWHDRFFAKIDQVRELGYTDAFIRMWQFYLCYCESAFRERATGTVQMLIMRPDARNAGSGIR